MSIHFILGKPGGGKSRWAAEKIVNELMETERVVLTNLPINEGNLNAYLQKHCKKDINLFERLVLLNDEQAAEFWTYRPPGLVMGEPGEFLRINLQTKEEWQQKKKPDYSHVKDKGVLYLIDEVHNFFNARSWMDTGRDVLYYNSQHRHLSDTVYFVTQDLELVDKQFRFLAQDYCTCMNMSKVKVSFWKMPAMFVWNLRVSPAENSPVVETGTFTLDKDGIASTYYTTRLVKGGKADMMEKRKGIPWYWGLVGLAILLLALFFILPKIIIRFVGGNISPKAPKQHESANQTNQVNQTSSPVSFAASDNVSAGGHNALRGYDYLATDGTNEVFCTGYSAITRPAQAWLSDGTIYRGAFRAGPNGILIGETLYRWARVDPEKQPKRVDPGQPFPIIQTSPKVTYVIKTPEGRLIGRANRNRDIDLDDESNQTETDLASPPNPVRSGHGELRNNEPASVPH